MNNVEDYFTRAAEEHLVSMGFVDSKVEKVQIDEFGYPVFVTTVEGFPATMRFSINWGVPKVDRSDAPCAFPGCSNKMHLTDLCHGHYVQKISGKTLKPLRKYRADATDEQKQLVVEGIHNGRTVTSLAEQIDMDISAVSRIYIRETGESVREYRNRTGTSIRRNQWNA